MDRNNINYTLAGDYYLPEMVSAEAAVELGRYGLRHKEFLRKNKRAVYRQLTMEGRLNIYLSEIDRSANEMEESLIAQLKKIEGINEALKSENQMSWIKAMNNILHRADEIVNSELIYT